MSIEGTPPDPFSPECLREIIRNVLKGQTYKTPDKSKLAQLSALLVRAHRTSPVLQELRETKAATEQLIEAIDALQDALFRFFPAMQPLGTLLDEIDDLSGLSLQKPGFVQTVTKADRLLTAAREARASLYDPTGLLFQRAAEQADRFNAYAPGVARAFVEAVERANPGLTIGLASNDGPLPRFMSAVAALASGERITAGAVKARLKKVKPGKT